MQTIGFIGTGIMGRHMAAHLQQAGHALLFCPHRRPTPPELLAAGGRDCPSPRAIAEAADVIILMVPDTPQVGEVLLADDGVVAGLSPGKLVIDMSSISPIETRTFAGRVGEHGCDYLDAPVSGGEVGAEAGTLTIMVGGPEAAFDRARPLFELMGRNITRVGDHGAGQTCKVANQIVVALTIEAVAEALLFASRAGVDPARVREALMGGFANSKILEVHGERMIRRTFEPGFRIGLHQKDLNLALSGARALGISLPNTATAQELFNACSGQGWGDLDHSAMARALELLAAHEIA